MQEVHVVTCFLEREGRVLLVRRSSRVSTYQQRWAGISGYLEPGASPLQQALAEVEEETGLAADQVEPVCQGQPLAVEDADLGRRWIVHPFRFRLVAAAKPRMDWEHSEMRWVPAEDLGGFDTVPGLLQAWEGVK